MTKVIDVNAAILTKLSGEGLGRERKMGEVFYNFASNVLNHATMRNDKALMAILDKARAEFQEAVK